MNSPDLHTKPDFFSKAITNYLDNLDVRGYSENTIRGYGRTLRLFGNWLSEVRSYSNVSDISRQDLMEFCQVLSTWKNRYGLPLTAATKNHHLNALRSFFRFQVKMGVLLTEPSSGLVNFRHQQKLPRVPSLQDILKVLAAAEGDDWRSIRDRSWIEVFYGSGLRLSELHNLDLVDYSPEEEILHIRLGKGEKDRYVPITPECKLSIDRYLKLVRFRLAREGDPALFLEPRGSRMKKRQFGVWLHKYSEIAGLKRSLTPHLLRHACATHLLRNGASLRHIQKLLGHTYLSTTQIYTMVEVQDLRDVMRRFHPRENFEE